MIRERDITIAATLHNLLAAYDIHGIPKGMEDGLTRYVMEGVEPGGFMRAVLENDFAAACMRADSTNILKLREYAMLCHATLPSQCWGSYAAVADWISKGGLRGRDN